MAKRKVRHALVTYTAKVDGRDVYQTAFRNQIIDVPKDQVDHLDATGATVPVDQDLDRPGRMLALPETATEGEILGWVLGATNDEVAALVKQRPVMGARIEAAQDAIRGRLEEQNEHLGGLKALADEAEAEQEKAAEKAKKDAEEALQNTPNPADPAANKEAEDLIGETFTAEQADALVAEGAKAATEHISNNPKHASLVLEAENRLASKEDREPRVSIVRTAEAAAGFTQ